MAPMMRNPPPAGYSLSQGKVNGRKSGSCMEHNTVSSTMLSMELDMGPSIGSSMKRRMSGSSMEQNTVSNTTCISSIDLDFSTVPSTVYNSLGLNIDPSTVLSSSQRMRSTTSTKRV